MTYSTDPDQLASEANRSRSTLLQRQGISGFSRTRVNKFVKLPRFDQLDPCCFSSADVSLDKTVVDNTPIQDVDVRRISKRLKIKHEKNGKS